MNNNFCYKHFKGRDLIIFFFALVILAMGSCKTTKKKGDMSPVTKFYHSATSLYNGYFNANVLLEEAIEDLTYDHSDNYAEILPIEKYMGSPNYKSAFPKLDTAIKKVSVVASIHRAGELTDDCYLLAAKAQYIKQDFEEAETTLKYLVKEFNPTDPGSQYWKYKKSPQDKSKKKARKKKKSTSTASLRNQYAAEAKKSSGLGGVPAFNEGRLWLAKTLIRRGLIAQAQGLINEVKGDYKRTKSMDNLYHTTQAQLYIHDKKYDKAALELSSAIDYAPDRDHKARYAFIAAQLYEKSGDHTRASIYYDKAQQSANAYEMVFNAQLNQLKSAYANGKRSRSSVLSSLEKMTKDGKNVDQLDYIYFTMAEIYRDSKSYDDAVEHYKKALAHKSQNSIVTLESYHELAMLYYDRDAFVDASTYLDSCLMIMPSDHERHKELQRLAERIEPIASNLRTISLLDSLIAISNMSPEEQREIALALKAKDDAKRTDEKDGLDKGQGKYAGGALSMGPGQQSVIPGRSAPRKGKYKGTFFAYQEDSKSKRAKAFEQTWGDIALVDNWRVSSIAEKSIGSSHEDNTDGNAEQRNLITNAEIERYLKNVPKNNQEIRTAETNIMKAMEELGFLYRSSISRPDLTIEILEELLTRFPDRKMNANVYYNLYLAYTSVNRIEKAEEYKNLIFSKYPDSSIAQNLKNPSSVSTETESHEKLALFYKSTYEDFTKGNYQNVHARVLAASKNFGSNNKYTAKFALLDAMAIGKTKGEAEYAEALRNLIKDHKGTQEAVSAKEILRFLDGGKHALVHGDLGNFQIDDEKFHYVLVYIKNPKEVNRNQAKISVSDFNEKYFGLEKLKVSTIFLDVKDNNNPIIIVRQFKNKKRAMNYYETAMQFKDKFMPTGAEYTILAANQQNYREILKTRTIVDYVEFFESYYLTGK